MNAKVLFVDDEPNVLQSIKRNLRKRLNIDTAESGDEALQKMAADGNYAVLVSDMRMPGMDGVELLSKAREEWPDTVRMMLTGNADQKTAVAAVNHGDIFRFLNKPCDPELLELAVVDAIRQHQLITAERDLLENTLRGSIKALADVLSLTNPEIFGHTTRYKRLMGRLVDEMNLPNAWELESTALLSQLGCVSIAQDLVTRKIAGHPLPDDELEEFAAHAKIGADLLGSIPRLDAIADSVRYQERNYDGSGFPQEGPAGIEIPLGARLLKVILDFDAFETSGAGTREAIGQLRARAERYDPTILDALESLLKQVSTGPTQMVEINALTDNMVIADDIRTTKGVLLVAKGQEATFSVRRHLQNYADNDQIQKEVLAYSIK